MISRTILCILVLATCASAQTAQTAPPPPQVDIVPDVVYGHKDGLALTFDVIKPKKNANGAAVIFMVSGGWLSPHNWIQITDTNFRLKAELRTSDKEMKC